jgi:alpha-amylase
VDEFHLDLAASDFNSAGDTLFIYFGRRNSGYSDARIYGIWSGPRSMNIINDLFYQTYTDYGGFPSGLGIMNWANFKPNLDNSTGLAGDWDSPYFFSDYDQFQEDTKEKLIDWTKWNWENVGMRGVRMDAVKHFTPEFVGDLLDSLHASGMDPGLVVGEWYSTNSAELAGWVNSVLNYMEPATKTAITPRIFDFFLREHLRQSCDNEIFDVRNVFQGSITDASGLSGYHIVPFLNNHDFRDNSGFASLIHNDPILGYVYIFTNNKVGLPCVFYPDYFGYPADPVAFPYFPSGL